MRERTVFVCNCDVIMSSHVGTVNLQLFRKESGGSRAPSHTLSPVTHVRTGMTFLRSCHPCILSSHPHSNMNDMFPFYVFFPATYLRTGMKCLLSYHPCILSCDQFPDRDEMSSILKLCPKNDEMFSYLSSMSGLKISSFRSRMSGRG